METTSKKPLTQDSSPSLIEFLLGDGTHPGWLDAQSHHQFGTIALRYKNCCGRQIESCSAKGTGRNTWQSLGTGSEYSAIFAFAQNNETASVVKFARGSRSTLKF